jgi:hypothetical protein
MTILVAQNLTTGRCVSARCSDGLPGGYAGLHGNTARTIVRGVPDGTDPRHVSRQLDLLAVSVAGTPKFSDPDYVVDYANLPAFDGIVFMGL